MPSYETEMICSRPATDMVHLSPEHLELIASEAQRDSFQVLRPERVDTAFAEQAGRLLEAQDYRTTSPVTPMRFRNTRMRHLSASR